MARRSGVTGVADSMTVRAQKVALRGFSDESSKTSAELSEAKLLRRWISVVELHRLRARGVAAIDTTSAVRSDQVELPLPTSFVKRSTELLAPPIAPGFRRLFRGPEAKRHLRCVVVAEGRAFEAEAAPVQRTDLSVDDHLRGELAPTSVAHE
jgi:hypothetical protein